MNDTLNAREAFATVAARLPPAWREVLQLVRDEVIGVSHITSGDMRTLIQLDQVIRESGAEELCLAKSEEAQPEKNVPTTEV